MEDFNRDMPWMHKQEYTPHVQPLNTSKMYKLSLYPNIGLSEDRTFLGISKLRLIWNVAQSPQGAATAFWVKRDTDFGQTDKPRPSYT